MATVQNRMAAAVKKEQHECVSCGSRSENHTEPGYLDKWNGITQWTCPDCVIEFRETANNAELAHRHGVSVHQVGEVYGNAPADTLKVVRRRQRRRLPRDRRNRDPAGQHRKRRLRQRREIPRTRVKGLGHRPDADRLSSEAPRPGKPPSDRKATALRLRGYDLQRPANRTVRAPCEAWA